MSMSDYPFVTVDIYDVVRSQFLHVNERQRGEADKDEDVTNEGEIGVVELMRNNSFQFVFGQELPFLAVLALASGKAERGLIWNCANGLRGILPL